MALADIGLFGALKTRMNWLQQRQSVLAENVANADTPHYRARDLAPMEGPREGPGPVRTNARHLVAGTGQGGQPRPQETESFEVRPRGNSVTLEDEMMKVAETQMDYQLATGLYARGIGILKTALGRTA